MLDNEQLYGIDLGSYNRPNSYRWILKELDCILHWIRFNNIKICNYILFDYQSVYTFLE